MTLKETAFVNLCISACFVQLVASDTQKEPASANSCSSASELTILGAMIVSFCYLIIVLVYYIIVLVYYNNAFGFV
uniref:Uncharacterized protein n=1 Tax=Rhizophora mucronata TaxID=61149 RepID=A0A2P2NQK8_RHIMU